jgi:hypothetical protein
MVTKILPFLDVHVGNKLMKNLDLSNILWNAKACNKMDQPLWFIQF